MSLLNPFWYAGGSDPFYANVVLLLHCDGTNGSTSFPDNSPSPKTMNAIGNAQVTTTNPKFGTGAMLLDGTGDYVATVSGSNDFNFGTSTDFTLECWANIQGDGYFLAVQNRSFYFGILSGFMIFGNGVVNPIFATINYSSYRNKWTNVAVTRSGTTIRVFLDGEIKQTVTSSASFGANSALNIGRDPSNSNFVNGRIDDVRITKGVARYTANFTPPTAPFPNS